MKYGVPIKKTMDNSQSSDVFSDSVPSCDGSSFTMDTQHYDSLLHKTRASLCNNVQIKKVSFPNHFSTLLEDCRRCITQSLDLVVNILTSDNISHSKLSQYMDNSVSMLQMLSALIKNIVESISMSCSFFKTFPTTTGQILLLVFTHCKKSEAIYGMHLNNVQIQLKDLFRTCHELQLTYLMVLEKHFIFDPSERDQLNVIIGALDINLKIGQVVQSLDVKTMAEQWKAYTTLCEKYSSHLMDKFIYQQCIQTLCCMIVKNLKTALEADQDEKVIIRSLKVTNFVIKIMLKICIIFRTASSKDYSRLVDMLIFVHLQNPAYLELEENRPALISGMSTNVCSPAHVLLMELIVDECFVNYVVTYDIRSIMQDDKLLGYMLLVVNMMKCVVHKSEEISFTRDRLIDCVFNCLPFYQVWINIGLRFKNESKHPHSYGFFEHVLMHTIALVLTFDTEELRHVEKTMLEAVLGIECFVALFASSLWTALAKISDNGPLILSQMISLCKMYKKLESHKMFLLSPQKQYFAHTLSSLFGTMREEDRTRLSSHFNPLDSRNMSLWIILRIGNLPLHIQRNVNDEILERFKQNLMSNIFTKESAANLNKLMRLAASCSCSGVGDDMEDYLIQAWTKACPKNFTFLSRTVDTSSQWYYEYVEALGQLTCAMEVMFYQSSVNLIKVLHVVLNILQIGNTELNLMLEGLLCKLAILPVHDENKNSVSALVKECFGTILKQNCSSNIVKNILFTKMNTCDKSLQQIISSVIAEDQALQVLYDNFRIQNVELNRVKLKEQLMNLDEIGYEHKCMPTRLQIENVDEINKTCSGNFDLVDLDTLFDNESDSEQPVKKKAKLDCGEAQAILDRLEKDASLLCSLDKNSLNSENRNRIKDVCEKMRRIVE